MNNATTLESSRTHFLEYNVHNAMNLVRKQLTDILYHQGYEALISRNELIGSIEMEIFKLKESVKEEHLEEVFQEKVIAVAVAAILGVIYTNRENTGFNLWQIY